MRILCIVGTRPNFIKIDPIFRALARYPDRFAVTLLHTGQHYDSRMSDVFFDELGLKRPEINLGVGSGTHAEQTAAVMCGVEKVLLEDRHDLVLVVGDVNSSLAATLAAVKLRVPVAHVEAGLRSFDRSMPEEINRLLIDVVCDLLLTSSRDADENLLREGVAPEKIHFVGNVMIDTLLRCRDLALSKGAVERLELKPRNFALVTLHRPGNVDDPRSLSGLLDALEWTQQRLPVIFPVHPRTVSQLEKFGLRQRVDGMSQLRLLPPLGYLDFLALQASARVVLSDSGGVQEETTVLGVPCLTLRENTERPITITQGTSRLVGNEPARIIGELERVLAQPQSSTPMPEYWDGRAAERIAQVLLTWRPAVS